MDTNKELNRRIRFVQQAQSKEAGRPVLHHTHVNHDIVACDGYRLHAIQNDLPEERLGLFSINNGAVRVNDNTLYFRTEEGTYPEVSQVIPAAGPPAFEITINAKQFKEALQHLDDFAKITFREGTMPIEIRGKVEGKPAYALIMPVVWKPNPEDDFTYTPGGAE